ncbi:hypothetical protein HZS_7016 [Henneguya salminicola]|nr:hypothetical protein HZS_7016 [Henneguya salminicola]
MHYNSHTFIDETFRTTPHSFYQYLYLIVRVFDQGTRIYVFCVYELVANKTSAYSMNFFSDLSCLWQRIIANDFEISLISAIKRKFTESN